MTKIKTVLVVDDDAANCELLSMVLESNGYAAEAVKFPEKALEMVKSKPYDLIISDLVMPGVSGIDLIRKMAAIREDQKVIIMTAHGDVDSFIESVHGLGALEYISKTDDAQKIVDVVNKLLTPAK